MPHRILNIVPALVALALVVPFTSSCASAPRDAERVQLTGAYAFSGFVHGQRVEGTVTFPEGGGYVLDSTLGSCSRTTDRDAQRIRWTRSGGTLPVGCGEHIRLDLKLLDGTIANEATAYRFETVYRETPVGCAQRNENGVCVRQRYVDEPQTVSYEGLVSVRPL